MDFTNTSEYVRQGSPVVGEYSTLSPQDILQTNRMYSCPCQAGTGTLSDLRIFIRHGVDLPADIGSEKEVPDPYVSVTAVDCGGNKVVKKASIKYDSRFPTWNQWLSFGVRRWQFFRISVWDSDAIYFSQTIEVSFLEKSYQVHCLNHLCEGYILLDYTVNRENSNLIKSSTLQKTNSYACTFFLLLVYLKCYD